ncbi:MAG: HEAT repeat domain-containing protein [Candidatus Thermoplasmatota archaeon]|nr:HEAT repeat domain-containing protein [Candidatus Thermoplasmatota archaeon]MEC7590163.1 HEAT repeat domain-containing protein [Candidatus Thermoplasmatota archaeon]MEC8313372.1 HEAT repeat domain-containing protein [Candidatus Thermoplasmatota archaeon]
MNNKPKVSQYGSVDPAPPLKSGEVQQWESTLTDNETPMFQRMRNVFSLRNKGTVEACLALCSGFKSESALLRHEVAYVLGQMQNEAAIPTLIQVLGDEEEHVMVRHEAAEALGAIGDYSVKPILENYVDHPMPEIAESCEVAIDLLNWCKSKEYDEVEC